MFRHAGVGRLAVLLITLLSCPATAWPDSLVSVSSPAGQAANDFVRWSQLGPNATLIGTGFSTTSMGGVAVTGALTGANSIVSVVCPAAACGWSGGFSAADTLLWTSDAGNSGNGPLTVTFGTGITGAGAFIQANAPGQFTAQIKAFNGATMLGTFAAMSDSNGDPTYIGVQDQTGPNITKVTISLTACGSLDTSSCTDFAVDTLNLNAGPAVASIASRSLAFGVRPVGMASTAQTAALANTGGAYMAVNSAVASGANSGDFNVSSAACSSPLAPGGSCLLSVTFSPTAGGPRKSAISVNSNAASGPATTLLMGVGTAAAVTPASLSFAAQTVGTPSASKTVTIKNMGSIIVNLWQIAILGANSGDFLINNTCGTTLGVGANCMVNITFKPTATGMRSAALLFSDDGGGSPQNVALTGTGQ